MSIQFEVKRTFLVPPQQAYAGLLDLDSARNWMQGLVEIKRLDDDPLRPGSQWKETRKVFEKKSHRTF